LDISLAGTGAFFIAWLAFAIPTVIYLAGRKSDTRRLTIFWGIVAAGIPPLGLLFTTS
jgi:hypothetical protein